MNPAAQFAGSAWLDDDRRLVWIGPLALGLWVGLLAVFAHLLSQTAAPPAQVSAVEARLVELPAPAGLQSTPPASRAPVAAPKPAVHHVAPHHAAAHHAPRPLAPAVPASAEGTAKAAPSSDATPGAQPSSSATATTDTGDDGGSVSGSDNSGARAIYAPAPEIPDELRDEPLDTVAVAHFVVASDGGAQVTLTQPTPNSRLNDLLLETLRRWRFASATRNGVAVESQFDIRIPVTIQ